MKPEVLAFVLWAIEYGRWPVSRVMCSNTLFRMDVLEGKATSISSQPDLPDMLELWDANHGSATQRDYKLMVKIAERIIELSNNIEALEVIQPIEGDDPIISAIWKA